MVIGDATPFATSSTATVLDVSEDEPLTLHHLCTERTDATLSILELLGGPELCACACACKAFGEVAHDETLWLPVSAQLSPEWTAHANPRFGNEPLWSYTLRIRHSQFSASVWKKHDDHRNGRCPYLAEIGKVVAGNFIADKARLCTSRASKLKYGAICELVHLEAAREGDGGQVSHRTYKAVAEEIAGFSADAKTAMPPDLHMVVREVYKSCYVGFGMAAGAAAAGNGFGEPGSLANVIARKGVVRRVSREAMGGGVSSPHSKGAAARPGSPTTKQSGGRRVSRESMTGGRGPADEEMRKHLEMQHSFVSLLGSSAV